MFSSFIFYAVYTCFMPVSLLKHVFYWCRFSHLGDVAFLRQDKLVRSEMKESAELSMPYKYINYFVGTNGRHVKPLIKKYDVTKLCIKPSKKYEKSVMSFVIQGSDSSEFTQVLQSRAEQVVLKREQHFNNVLVSK